MSGGVCRPQTSPGGHSAILLLEVSRTPETARTKVKGEWGNGPARGTVPLTTYGISHQ